jgi:hypothetical protein
MKYAIPGGKLLPRTVLVAAVLLAGSHLASAGEGTCWKQSNTSPPDKSGCSVSGYAGKCGGNCSEWKFGAGIGCFFCYPLFQSFSTPKCDVTGIDFMSMATQMWAPCAGYGSSGNDCACNVWNPVEPPNIKNCSCPTGATGTQCPS